MLAPFEISIKSDMHQFELSSKLPDADLKGMPDTDSWFDKLLKKLH